MLLACPKAATDGGKGVAHKAQRAVKARCAGCFGGDCGFRTKRARVNLCTQTGYFSFRTSRYRLFDAVCRTACTAEFGQEQPVAVDESGRPLTEGLGVALGI